MGYQRDGAAVLFFGVPGKISPCRRSRTAHQQNDRAVMDAYGFVKGTEARTSESACVAELMKLYQKLSAEKNAE